ncbi:MAG: hypothetical protein EBV19_06445 [Flavobacteriia bacterium]|nr:hypothetical protein [Flavobacteriia bacterium]
MVRWNGSKHDSCIHPYR